MNLNLLRNRPKNGLITLFAIAALSWMPAGYARDEVQSFPLDQALNSADAKSKLGDSIKFAFGTTSIGKVTKNHGEFRANKKTNAFGKSDAKACNWAFLSAMISLKDRAVNSGGNAVINIRSNYKNNTTSSESTFQCGAGNILAGVALIGDIVTVN